MAREFRLLSVLWLVVACLAATTTTEDLTITTGVNTTVAANVTATTATPTTTTVAANVTATTATPTTTTTATPTTTTVAANVTATTATPTTTTTATPTTTTVAANVTATTATPTTTTTATPTTTTVAANITATTATSTTTTTATPTTTTVAANVTATTATPTTTTTATPTTTTVAANVTATTATPTTTTTATPTTTTVAANVTATTATPTTTTTATPTTTTVAANVTATTATPTTTTTATPTTTTVAGNITAATATPTNTSIAANATSSTPVPTTIPDPCDGKPCRDGSTCEPRVNQNFTCLCLAGEYDYDLKICERAKVFPGQLDLPSLKFNENMTVKTSPEFQEASLSITNELESVFEESDGFSGSIVLELRKLPSKDSKVWSRSEDGVSATIEIFFNANTDISTAEVTKTIENVTECGGCLLASGSFDVTDLCDKEPCDLKTTTCASGNGSFSCNCLEDYVRTNFSDRMCIACPSGQRPDGPEECVKCQFGRSGFNCNESWQLVLVIVGSVLGGLLLITLILLPILAHKPSKKSSKKNKKSDTEKSYDSHPHAKAPLVNNSLANSQAASVNEPTRSLSAFANAGVPRIPRATSTNSWNSRTNLEMTPSNSRQNLIPMGRNPRLYDDHDDMNPYAQARPQSSLYAQARPQNNPYAQNRPQTNPYAPSQGHSNPYYMHDNGRRFN